MKKKIFLLFILIISSKSFADDKINIIQNYKNVENLTFNFEQNINGKIENGFCTIKYPKKILCSYTSKNKKILISNGRSLVIKTNDSYYIYPIEKTPLNFILDKEFILKKISNSNGRTINNKYINFKFQENGNDINLFFDKNTYNLIGWQTLDIYQNLSITYINSIKKNIFLKKNFFKLPAPE
jgi:outer membrane lipoprotein-sorting protein